MITEIVGVSLRGVALFYRLTRGIIMCAVRDKISSLSKNISNATCMKCGVSPAVTTARMKDPFCRACFEVYFTHRFRATFGKAKIVRQGEKVLVCFSGGASSRVLLKLIEDGLHKDAAKKLRFVPTVIYIDESVLARDMQTTPSQHKQHFDHVCSILSIAAQTGFPVVYTRLEEVLGSSEFWYLSDILKHSTSVQIDGKSEMTVDDRPGRGLEGCSDDPLLSTDNVHGQVKDCSLPKVQEEMSEEGDMPLNHQTKGNVLLTEGVSDSDGGLRANVIHPEASSGPSITVNTPCNFLHSSAIRDSINSLCPVSVGLREELCTVFSAAKSTSAKENLLYLFRRKLFERAALRLGLSKIVVGDSASLLSVRLLGNIAQGRGATVPLDTAFCDDRGEIAILRPLREFPQSEIASYCAIAQLDIINTPHLFTGEKSISGLTDTFVNRLQADFPSTISTIFRTSDKLFLDLQTSPNRCLLCQVPLGLPPDGDVFNHICIAEEYFDPATLCYGCRLTLNDLILTRDVVTTLMKLSDKDGACLRTQS